MDYKLLRRLVVGKLRDRGTYVVAFVVGTLINLYGQILVPWLRGIADPMGAFVDVLMQHPATTILSVFLGYAFPFLVGTYSAVVARYKSRRMESVADFPERKPDPVFRVTRDGKVIEAGARTRKLLESHDINHAAQILGDKVWSDIQSDRGLDAGTTVRFEPEGVRYVVTYALTADDNINIYLGQLDS